MPVCYAITVNEEPPVVAGGDLIDVLVATVTFVRERGELELHAGGLVSKADHDNEHIDWLRQNLRVGDRVVIKVVDSGDPLQSVKRERLDPGFSEREERRYYEQLKQKYEPR